jgi:hypothetical protein
MNTVCAAASSAGAYTGRFGTKVNIFGGDSIGHFEQKVYMNMRLILNGYQDTDV